ncbi:wall-associated receptor kinase 2-like [Phragmites australis]|uniref:wall-associated receptor kinase 2-like n=1 Tax=Phragmites australis TaxID=29695 RepID=UPI002D7A22F2|nr:wall-associated receptor kinase 2-like [Phragmites australis]
MPTAFNLVPCLLLAALMAFSATPEVESTSDCPDSCGGIAIQYPFGIGTGCFRKGFEIICDRGLGMPVLAGTTRPVPVNLLSIRTAEARVMLPVAWECFNSSDKVYDWSDGNVQFNHEEVYRISNTHNQLVVIGCNTLGYTRSQRSEGNDYPYAYYTGCMSFCNNSRSAVNGACAGVGCCHVDIPPGLTDNRMSFEEYTHKARLDFSPCDYAFLVDRDNYTFHTADLKMDVNATMPVWLDWAIRDNLTCEEVKKKVQSYACVSSNSECHDSSNGPGYVCNCSMGYQGNPYIADGCTDINECENHQEYPCRGVCRNTLGSYECKCPGGSRSADPFNQPCNPNFPLAAKIAIGAVGGLFIIAVVVFASLLGKEKRKMKEFFRKNGGPIIEEVNKIKLFRKEELEPILKRSNCIGQGGFGEVYKGYLRDETQPVAVKKPKIDIKLAGQFANEVIIQSRVLHKNIVKLIGCCLEVDVPILVYEYVSNGSLDKILHDNNRVPLDLELRLQIAAQSAKGLAYMHSEITMPILHGDVKPANILLDVNFVPKISDFGTSRMITVDENYTSTIIGNWGYMDPEYVQTGLYTSKSDVYSFGVVLLELITRKKALDPDINSILGNSHDAYTKKKRVIELVDPEIAATGNIGIFHSLAEIIVQCLDLDVDLRPEMTDVAERLQYLVK